MSSYAVIVFCLLCSFTKEYFCLKHFLPQRTEDATQVTYLRICAFIISTCVIVFRLGVVTCFQVRGCNLLLVITVWAFRYFCQNDEVKFCFTLVRRTPQFYMLSWF